MLVVSSNNQLSKLNTMGIGGTARALVSWVDACDLRVFFSDPTYAQYTNTVKPIGQGSNLLFVNDSFSGTLLACRNETVEIVRTDENIVCLKVGAGKPLDNLVRETASRGLWGLENLGLIPGTVGAAAVQNVGAYGVEFGSLVESVECYDRTTGECVNIRADELAYGYRDSLFKHKPARDRYIVCNVTVVLSLIPRPVLTYGNLVTMVSVDPGPLEVYDAVCRTRRAKLPDVETVGSAGSFFKNPVVSLEEYDKFMDKVTSMGIVRDAVPSFPCTGSDSRGAVKLSAAWLIDRAGWKGVVKGNVGTWPTQPLVIVNMTGNATGDEVRRLAADISHDINDRFGIILVPEVEYIE